MNNLTGTWEGEYSINVGTDEEPQIEYHGFRIELADQNGKLSGTSKDLTLSDEPSKISGFRDNKIISFIKKYDRQIFLDEGSHFADGNEEHSDIHYSGVFNQSENCFEGTWEIHEDEEQEGLQESFEERYFTGNWYMRRTN